MKPKDKRHELFMQVIRKLNKQKAFYSHIFNCGKLGILEVIWDVRWDAKWYKNVDVDEFLKDKEANKSDER